MEFDVRWRTSAERIFTAIVIATSLLSVVAAALAADIGALIKKLDRSEWEIVSEAVIDRLPNLIRGKAEQAYFKQVMQTSQEAAAIAEALKYGNYEGLGAVSAKILVRDLEKMVASRFGEESRLYKTIQIVKSEPRLARELTRAALNADAWAANKAIRASLKEYAKKRASELRQQGEKFWKDMFRNVIPGGNRLSGLGFDPVDLYLQGISDWSDFTSQTRLRFNNTMLDCLALRYRKIRKEGYSGKDARLEIENFDTGTGIGNNFRCSVELDRLNGSTGEKSVTRRVIDFFINAGRSTVALAELGMTTREIIDLIEQYEREGGQDKHARFSIWLQKRLLKNIKTRKEGLTGPIAEAQKKIAKEQVDEANKLMAAIEAEIGRLKPRRAEENRQTAPRGKEDKPVAGGKNQGNGERGQSANNDGGTGKEKPAPPRVTLQCDKLTALVASVEQKLAGSRLDDPGGLIANLTAAESKARKEGSCPPEVFAGAARSRTRLQAIASLRQRITAAISACNIDAMPSLKAEIARVSPTIFLNEESLLQTAQTGVSAFKTGRAAYDRDSYKQAKGDLQSSLRAFRELTSGACQTYADRAQSGLDIIEKIEAQQVRVNRAIAACDMDELKKILASYRSKKHRFFRSAMARVNAALPKCRKEDQIIAEGKFCEEARRKLSVARADFLANHLNQAERELRKLRAALKPEKTRRCLELKPKVQQGLANIDILRTEDARLQQTVANCNIGKLDKLKDLYISRRHPWYEEAALRARAGITACRRGQEDDCRRQARDMGKVFAAITYKENGEYSCHTCEKGQIPEGNVCVPDRAAAVADCRRVAAQKGKVYAKTEIRNDGTPICHWCEPGQIYYNGKCGTRAAHEEVNCRQMAAQRGKVYATTEFLRNGQVRCRWCEPGQFYRNGQCHSRVVRTCPNGYVLRGTRCYPQGGGQAGSGRRPPGGNLRKPPCMVDLRTAEWDRRPDCEVPR